MGQCQFSMVKSDFDGEIIIYHVKSSFFSGHILVFVVKPPFIRRFSLVKYEFSQRNHHLSNKILLFIWLNHPKSLTSQASQARCEAPSEDPATSLEAPWCHGASSHHGIIPMGFGIGFPSVSLTRLCQWFFFSSQKWQLSIMMNHGNLYGILGGFEQRKPHD